MVCTYKFRSTIFFQVTVSRASSPGTNQQTRDNTDPACVDCARGFAPGVLRSYTG